MSQRRSLVNRAAAVDLFCDAANTPPRIGIILAIQGRMAYTDWEVPPSVLRMFRNRRDGQILGLELLAILIGDSSLISVLVLCILLLVRFTYVF